MGSGSFKGSIMREHHVLLIVGGKHHDYEKGGAALAESLQSTGIGVEVTGDASAVQGLSGGKYDCVMLYTQGDRFDGPQVEALTKFVRGGGGLVGVHSATATNKDDPKYAALLGSRFMGHGPVFDFKVSVSDPEHPIAHRVQDYRITDELYVSQPVGEVRPFLTAWWKGKQEPMGYTRQEGKGRVVYLANGHDLRSLTHPTVRQMLVRAVRYAAGEDWSEKTVKVGVIGYGGAFNMGKLHAESCNRARMKTVVVCDLDPKRTEMAKQELGAQVRTFATVDEMLEQTDVEMCIVITPHNTHAPLSIQCLEAGRHVVTEKPYTITVEEATAVIETARRVGKMATVFHNRRWDGDFMTMRQIVRSGAIGDVFHIETFFGGYSEPRPTWWRSSKEISGGAFYDWGAHFCDWVLNLMPHRIESISGSFHKRMWHQVSNEDHTEAFVRFEGGRTASIQLSSLAAVGKAKWRILGTLGGIEMLAGRDQPIRVISHREGLRHEATVPAMASDWDGFYRNVADHLMLGEPLAVTPESARKVIAVLSLAEESSRRGGAPVGVGFEQ
jgi:scyllo-inositol 2-dehydrogenase (NADP+)